MSKEDEKKLAHDWFCFFVLFFEDLLRTRFVRFISSFCALDCTRFYVHERCEWRGSVKRLMGDVGSGDWGFEGVVNRFLREFEVVLIDFCVETSI